ncbi:hypothetical protein BN2475_230028 [Paraburkholderia ribeironis]|uniref:Uncharacterized protein n=1 Tax=Paraburkholderia ribeironis TaxID=1247936 RepID=A0A1N7RYS2_9BURK|nr:hypothetical protein BN2475_230028 [Paraburkholderia ribeironis]
MPQKSDGLQGAQARRVPRRAAANQRRQDSAPRAARRGAREARACLTVNAGNALRATFGETHEAPDVRPLVWSIGLHARSARVGALRHVIARDGLTRAASRCTARGRGACRNAHGIRAERRPAAPAR